MKGNLKTQPLESADQSIACTLRVQAVEEIIAQFLILRAIAQDAEGDGEQLVGGGDNRLANAMLASLAVEEGSDV